MAYQIELSRLTKAKLQNAAYDADMAVEDLIVQILSEWSTPRPTVPVAKRVAAHRERNRQRQYGADYRERRCEWCGGEMGRYTLPNAKYCTARCRQAAYRARVATRPL